MTTSALAERAGKVFLSRRRRGVGSLPYLLLVPSIILILLIEFYPFLSGLLYSLRNGSLLQAGAFVGLRNYIDLWTMPDFLHALYFSAIFAFFNVCGSYIIGLGLAMLLIKEVPARGFFRVALLIPWIIPSIVSIVSWRWLIQDQHGSVNVLLSWLHLGPIYFLSSGVGATFSVIIIKIWRSFPFMMISLIAALQTIDQELYEAGRIDGAGRWALFRYITFPQIKTVSIILWILMTIWTVNDFDTPWLLAQGGPSHATENLIVLAYRYTFTGDAVGMGSAIALVTLIILMVLAILLMRYQGEPN
jgi:ABC-type sugar transport system permease subunit